MRFAMDIRKAFSTPSEHVVEDMAVIDNAAGTSSLTTWLEKKRRPKKINARYPFKVKPLIYATCAFSNLGNALFGYNSGIMSGIRVNPVCIKRFFSDYGSADWTTAAVNPSITGICRQ